MINILHISTAKTWRGGEQQLAYMIDGLQNYEVKNHLLTVAKSDLSVKMDNRKVHIYTQNKSSGISLKWAKKIKQICVENNISIIHCHDSKAHTKAVLSAVFFNNKTPIIVHRKVIFKIKQRFFTKYKYNHASVKKIVCISKAVENEVKKVVKADKTTVIYSAKALNQKDTSVIDLKKSFELEESTKVIGYVAALTYEKDHDTFLKVAKQLVDAKENVFFFIIGEGKLKSQIQEQVKELKLVNHVAVTGFIKDAKFLIKQFDVLLFTSLLEGLGTTILDAFEFKTPVVTVKNGGGEELVLHRETGLICEKQAVDCLTKNVKELVHNPVLVDELTNKAYTRLLANHTSDKMVESLFDVYKKVSEYE